MMMSSLLLLLFVVEVININIVVMGQGYLPSKNPPWQPTYNVTESLITMQCNSLNYSNVQRATQFGIVSYDWSNAKKLWSTSLPMDCEEKLNEQAMMLHNARRSRKRHSANNNSSKSKSSNTQHTFVYRNIVKALPWFSTVREKLVNPAYSGFFLKFADENNNYHVPKCAIGENASKCSNLYHDQEQTPQLPNPLNNYSPPDGICNLKYNVCDCGIDLPCGEYYFDHRNGTMLREFLVNEVILGALLLTTDDHQSNNYNSNNNNTSGSSNSNDDNDNNRHNSMMIVDGLFLDDYWCSNLLCIQSNDTIIGCPCNDPKQGPTESEKHAVIDMGLSDEDILNITLEWNITMSIIENQLLQHNAYTWWLIDGQENANAKPYLFDLTTTNTNDNNNDHDHDHTNNKYNNDDDDNQFGINNMKNHDDSILRSKRDDLQLDKERRRQRRQTTRRRKKSRSDRCIEILEDACQDDSLWQTKPRLFGFNVDTKTHQLINFHLDWSFFLLVRGPYTWAGYGVWGMTRPFQKEPAHGGLPPIPSHGIQLPYELTPEGQTDYGVPLGVCYRTTTTTTSAADHQKATTTNNNSSSSSSSTKNAAAVFRRDWSNGWIVEIDCKNYNNSNDDVVKGSIIKRKR